MPAPALTQKRLLIAFFASLALFLAFLSVGVYNEMAGEGMDGLGVWIFLMLCCIAFGGAQLILTIVLAAKGISHDNGFIQVFSMHNLVWFLGLSITAAVSASGGEMSVIFIPGILVSVAALLIILVRGQEERKQDSDMTDF